MTLKITAKHLVSRKEYLLRWQDLNSAAYKGEEKFGYKGTRWTARAKFETAMMELIRRWPGPVLIDKDDTL